MAGHTEIAVDARVHLVGHVGVVRAGIGRAWSAVCVSHSVASSVHTGSSVSVDSTAICSCQPTILGMKIEENMSLPRSLSIRGSALFAMLEL